MSKHRLRIALVVALAAFGIAPVFQLFVAPVHAQNLTDKAKKVGGKFMCMCSCSQVLTECNHVGCTTSASMLRDLNARLDRGESEDSITQAFVQEFGTQVYAEPPKSGFSLVAWLMPSFYLLLGTVLVVFVITRWRKKIPVAAMASGDASGISPELLARARAQAAKETED
jgi:cytochrome c-type biogenesis protein CcmH/NrfF